MEPNQPNEGQANLVGGRKAAKPCRVGGSGRGRSMAMRQHLCELAESPRDDSFSLTLMFT